VAAIALAAVVQAFHEPLVPTPSMAVEADQSADAVNAAVASESAVLSRDAEDVAERDLSAETESGSDEVTVDTEDAVALAEGLDGHSESSSIAVDVNEADQLSDEETVDDDAVSVVSSSPADAVRFQQVTTSAVATAKATTEEDAEDDSEDDAEDDVEADEDIESLSGDAVLDAEDAEFDGDYSLIEIAESDAEEEAEQSENENEDESDDESEEADEEQSAEEDEQTDADEDSAEADEEADIAEEEADSAVFLEAETTVAAGSIVEGGALEAVEEAISAEEAASELGLSGAPISFDAAIDAETAEDDSESDSEDSDSAIDTDELALENDSELNDAIAEATGFEVHAFDNEESEDEEQADE